MENITLPGLIGKHKKSSIYKEAIILLNTFEMNEKKKY
jgi:hypothetical protein